MEEECVYVEVMCVCDEEDEKFKLKCSCWFKVKVVDKFVEEVVESDVVVIDEIFGMEIIDLGDDMVEVEEVFEVVEEEVFKLKKLCVCCFWKKKEDVKVEEVFVVEDVLVFEEVSVDIVEVFVEEVVDVFVEDVKFNDSDGDDKIMVMFVDNDGDVVVIKDVEIGEEIEEDIVELNIVDVPGEVFEDIDFEELEF